jgi:RimK family alpha-L-glutamate ligase
MRYALVARHSTSTNEALAAATAAGVTWEPMSPEAALETLRSGDAALGRLDVLRTLDGVEDGLWALGALAARGVVVLNEPAALLGMHDKLLTAWLLKRSGIPHPSTTHVRPGRPFPAIQPPVVVKPRYGSWGGGVVRCDDERSLLDVMEEVQDAPWFARQGALLQDLVPPVGYDLRVLVAGGRVAGAVYRDAAPGEWRTNISLGGVRRRVSDLPPEAHLLARAAAEAAGASLVGVDLLPTQKGFVVLELNGAVEFRPLYAPGRDVFADVVAALIEEGVRQSELAAASV